MGWQDRDWAKLDEDELADLYGVLPTRRVSTGAVVWPLLAVVVAGFGACAYTHREHASPGPPVPAFTAPSVIYGQPTTIGGVPGACVEEEVVADGSWQCDDDQLATGATRVVSAASYDGPCVHLRADQTSGRWVCVSAG